MARAPDRLLSEQIPATGRALAAFRNTHMPLLVPIGTAARELGVHPDALRRWEGEGRIEPAERTPGGGRRYDLAKLRNLAPRKVPSERVTIAYARVSASGHEDGLTRRIALLESFSAANGWAYEVIADASSGLNCNKRGLNPDPPTWPVKKQLLN